jgi:hypothetical protein
MRETKPWLRGQLEAAADDTAVSVFAAAMKEKMAISRAKGRSGWQQCSTDDLLAMLRAPVEKGDMRDVANIAMMIWTNKGRSVGLVEAPPLKWRHVKRGTEYVEIGRAELQMNFDGLVDGSSMVVYRGDDGKLWVREEGEFEDGRFERVSGI